MQLAGAPTSVLAAYRQRSTLDDTDKSSKNDSLLKQALRFTAHRWIREEEQFQMAQHMVAGSVAHTVHTNWFCHSEHVEWGQLRMVDSLHVAGISEQHTPHIMFNST